MNDGVTALFMAALIYAVIHLSIDHFFRKKEWFISRISERMKDTLNGQV